MDTYVPMFDIFHDRYNKSKPIVVDVFLLNYYYKLK